MQALVIPQWRLVANITVAGWQFLLSIEIYQFCMFSFLSASIGFKFYLTLWHVIVLHFYTYCNSHIISKPFASGIHVLAKKSYLLYNCDSLACFILFSYPGFSSRFTSSSCQKLLKHIHNFQNLIVHFHVLLSMQCALILNYSSLHLILVGLMSV